MVTTPAQYRLLERLVDADGQVVSRDEVVNTVWPEAAGEGVSEQAIDALVRRLRDRLAEVSPENQYIVTVRGHGFHEELFAALSTTAYEVTVRAGDHRKITLSKADLKSLCGAPTTNCCQSPCVSEETCYVVSCKF